MNIEYETTPSGKTIKIDKDNKEKRIAYMKEIQEKLNNKEITPEEATKLINVFGKKHKIFIK